MHIRVAQRPQFPLFFPRDSYSRPVLFLTIGEDDEVGDYKLLGGCVTFVK